MRCCAVLCCAVLCCAVLCCAVPAELCILCGTHSVSTIFTQLTSPTVVRCFNQPPPQDISANTACCAVCISLTACCALHTYSFPHSCTQILNNMQTAATCCVPVRGAGLPDVWAPLHLRCPVVPGIPVGKPGFGVVTVLEAHGSVQCQ